MGKRLLISRGVVPCRVSGGALCMCTRSHIYGTPLLLSMRHLFDYRRVPCRVSGRSCACPRLADESAREYLHSGLIHMHVYMHVETGAAAVFAPTASETATRIPPRTRTWLAVHGICERKSFPKKSGQGYVGTRCMLAGLRASVRVCAPAPAPSWFEQA